MKVSVSSSRRRRVAFCMVVALLVRAAALPVFAGEPGRAAQTPAAAAPAENVQASFSGGVATITYDLATRDGAATFDVTLEVSTNGGHTYDAQPRAVSGDVGRSVPAGPKRIVWEFAKDVESLQISQFRFRVVSRVEPQSGAAASTSQRGSDPLPVVQLPPATPTASATTRRQTGGNRLLWPGMAMFGGGGTLAALAGAGPLRAKTDYPTYYELKPSKPAMYGGIGIGAAGLVLMLVGRSRASSASTAFVVPTPRGIAVYRVTVF